MSTAKTPVEALEDERRFLLASLADLERERAAGDVSDDDYHALRDGYTVRAAQVLRALDGNGTRPSSGRPIARRWLRTAALTLLVAVAASVLVVRYVAPRQGSVGPTGDLPDTIAAKLSLARQLQSTGDASGAVQVYQDVLSTDPDNAEARTYLGWMVANTYLARDVDVTTADDVTKAAMASSERQLDHAIRVKPTYADPYCFKAIVRFRFYRDAAGAKPAIDACQASNPPAVVEALVANLAQEIDAAG